jgi:hypothetical protein
MPGPEGDPLQGLKMTSVSIRLKSGAWKKIISIRSIPAVGPVFVLNTQSVHWPGK